MDPTERDDILDGMRRGDVGVIVDVVRKYGLAIRGYGDDNSTLLHMAVVEAGEEFTSFLLASGADEQITNDLGENAFHTAAKWGKKDMVELMCLKRSLAIVDIPSSNETKQTAMHLACREGEVETMELMLDELDGDPYAEATLYGGTKVTPIHLAIHEDQLVSLFFLATWQNGKLLTIKGDHGDMPIHLCCRIEKIDALKVLVEKCDADSSLIHPVTGRTPLQEAVMTSNDYLADVLVEDLKANIDAKGSKKALKQGTALHLAVEIDKPNFVRKLLKWNANPLECDENGDTPFHWAIRKKKLHLAAILYQHCNEVNEARNRLGRTALMLACVEHGCAKTVRFLVEECKSSISLQSFKKDMDGATSFHLACSKKFEDCVKMLVKLSHGDAFSYTNLKEETAVFYFVRRSSDSTLKFLAKLGATFNDKNGATGRTSLHNAAISDDYSVAKLLMKYGADMMEVSKNQYDFNYNCPLLAAKNNSEEVFELFIETEKKKMRGADSDREKEVKIISAWFSMAITLHDDAKTMEFLTNYVKGVNLINQCGFLDRTPLHTACLTGRVNCVRQFLKQGADVKVKSNSKDLNRTPLHFACMGGHDEIVEMLLKHRADPKAKDRNGNNCCHLAAIAGSFSVFMKFIELEVDIIERGYFQKTLLHHACHWIGEENELAEANDEISQVERMENIAKVMKEVMVRMPHAGSSVVEGSRMVLLPIDTAYEGKLEIVKFLLENWQSPALSTCRDENGDRPIHVAAATGHTGIVKHFVKWNRQAFIEARGYLGRTPFQQAAIHFQKRTILYLLNEAKANPNVKSDSGFIDGSGDRTALHIIIAEGVLTSKRFEIIELLLDNGVNAEAGDLHGDRPLHYLVEACQRDLHWLDMIAHFADRPINFNALGRDGQTAFSRAIAIDNVKVVDFFLQLGLPLDPINDSIRLARQLSSFASLEYLEDFKERRLQIGEKTK